LEQARADLDTLKTLGEQAPPPCRTFLHLAERSRGLEGAKFVTALIFPAEYEEEIGQWLLAIEFQGGDLVEGGISHVSDYYAEFKDIRERQQLWSQPAAESRTAEEVFASVRRAVQR
jgi:hypothetical protein